MPNNNKKPMSFDRKLIILFAGMLTFVCSTAIAADTFDQMLPVPITVAGITLSSAP